MPKPFLAALFAAALAAGLSAQSPGFDCAKATAPQEKAICASPELSRADAEMTDSYRKLLASVPPEIQSGIRENQRAWLRTRLSRCKPGSDAEKFTGCLLEAENSRVEALKGMVAIHNGVTFVWQSIYLTAPNDPETVKRMEENVRPDAGYVSASWPQAMSSAPEWTAWNKAIADAAGSKDAPGKSKPGNQWSKEDAADADIDIDVSLDSVSDSLVTASITVESYGHSAAHPNHDTLIFNWMLKAQRPLSGEDIFRPQSKWKEDLYIRTDKYLHGALDETLSQDYQSVWKPGEMQKTVRALVIDPSHWQIDEKGLTILFNPYDVACYACTPEPFTMSWTDLRPLLNPSFQIPAAKP
jgi:uncharacterized protein